jgi:tryptophan synthase alpha chain
MSAIDQLFVQLRKERRKALIPFITAGDPDLQTTAELLPVLAQAGGSLLEIGIPYSDPIADGPVIQASYQRALERGVRLSQIFEAVARGRGQVSPPLVTMVSYAIVHRRGIESYLQAAADAGISGLIVPDLLVDEAAGLADACQARDISLIQLVTPTTPRDRQLRIAETTTGFLYYVSVTGITGERRDLPPELTANVAWLRQQTDLPICIGFGISQPEHVTQLAPVADGVIVGSALVRRIAELPPSGTADRYRSLIDYLATLQAALNPRA